MSDRKYLSARVDKIFSMFRNVFVPEVTLCKGELRQGGRFYLALDPLSPMQSLKNPRLGRYVLMRRERKTKKDDSRLCTQIWVSNVLAGFYALAVLDGQAARVAWFRFAFGCSLRECASEAGASYWMTRGYLTGEREPDLYSWWEERFVKMATPGDVYDEDSLQPKSAESF